MLVDFRTVVNYRVTRRTITESQLFGKKFIADNIYFNNKLQSSVLTVFNKDNKKEYQINKLFDNNGKLVRKVKIELSGLNCSG